MKTNAIVTAVASISTSPWNSARPKLTAWPRVTTKLAPKNPDNTPRPLFAGIFSLPRVHDMTGIIRAAVPMISAASEEVVRFCPWNCNTYPKALMNPTTQMGLVRRRVQSTHPLRRRNNRTRTEAIENRRATKRSAGRRPSPSLIRGTLVPNSIPERTVAKIPILGANFPRLWMGAYCALALEYHLVLRETSARDSARLIFWWNTY